MPVCSVMSDSLWPHGLGFLVPLSMEFSRQEHWSGLPFPPPEDLPDPGIEPVSSASAALAGAFFTTEPLNSILNNKCQGILMFPLDEKNFFGVAWMVGIILHMFRMGKLRICEITEIKILETEIQLTSSHDTLQCPWWSRCYLFQVYLKR